MSYRFYFCDPVASFREGSQGKLSRRIFGSYGEAKLGHDVWEIGLKAYDVLSTMLGKQASIVDLEEFAEGTQPQLDQFFDDLSKNILLGHITFVRSGSGSPYKLPLAWKQQSWTWKITTMLNCIVDIANEHAELKIVEGFESYFAIAALYELDLAVLNSITDCHEEVIKPIIRAKWLMEQVDSVARLVSTVKAQHVKLDSQRASERARARHARDPKHAARIFVHECWLAWLSKPEQYPSAAAFARAMLDKEPDTLTSEVVIARWVRGWANSKK